MGDETKGSNDSEQSGRRYRLAVFTTARQDFVDLLARKIVKIGTEKVEKPIEDFREKLPSDSKSVRELPFYDTTLKAIQWQRDNYLVGTEYANDRKAEEESRKKNQEAIFSIGRNISDDGNLETPNIIVRNRRRLALRRMPFDATALGHCQIVHLGSWFIPSPTIHQALLPIVVSLPNGTLKETIVTSAANAIPLAQPSLDSAVKYSMMQFMDDPYWRQVIKKRTKGYMGSGRGD